MCRLIVFVGVCTRCGEPQTWEEYSQKLSCLEAKNYGIFGECAGGVFVEQHSFDSECDICAEEDEGIGDINDIQLEEDIFMQDKPCADQPEPEAVIDSGKKAKQSTS